MLNQACLHFLQTHFHYSTVLCCYNNIMHPLESKLIRTQWDNDVQIICKTVELFFYYPYWHESTLLRVHKWYDTTSVLLQLSKYNLYFNKIPIYFGRLFSLYYDRTIESPIIKTPEQIWTWASAIAIQKIVLLKIVSNTSTHNFTIYYLFAVVELILQPFCGLPAFFFFFLLAMDFFYI